MLHIDIGLGSFFPCFFPFCMFLMLLSVINTLFPCLSEHPRQHLLFMSDDTKRIARAITTVSSDQSQYRVVRQRSTTLVIGGNELAVAGRVLPTSLFRHVLHHLPVIDIHFLSLCCIGLRRAVVSYLDSATTLTLVSMGALASLSMLQRMESSMVFVLRHATRLHTFGDCPESLIWPPSHNHDETNDDIDALNGRMRNAMIRLAVTNFHTLRSLVSHCFSPCALYFVINSESPNNNSGWNINGNQWIY
jgi:hypothetical protein